MTVSWLWSQHNEHRIPLPRLLMLGIYRLKPDFRVPMFVNVFLMAVLSALLKAQGLVQHRAAFSYRIVWARRRTIVVVFGGSPYSVC